MPQPFRLTFPFPSTDVFVPDGVALDDAVSRVTDLVVVAHADDAEFAVPAPIFEAYDDPDRWVCVCVCTDGARSPRAGPYAETSDTEMIEIRRREQREAAVVGRYGLLVQLGHASADVRAHRSRLGGELASLLAATRPDTVHTHAAADSHPTHVAVAHACIDACRALPVGSKPDHLLGWAGWRSLDWVPEAHVVRIDVSGHDDLASALLAVFDSQISGGKRYDLAALGRRRVDATLAAPQAPDTAEQAVVALDMTPLLDPGVDPRAWLAALLGEFTAEVLRTFDS